MELKDVILSTLAEMEDINTQPQSSDFEVKETITEIKNNTSPEEDKSLASEDDISTAFDSEHMYLNSIRERLLVLFEGFQAPNNTNIEAKVDMTLNFLEYILATIDNRVEILEKGNKK